MSENLDKAKRLLESLSPETTVEEARRRRAQLGAAITPASPSVEANHGKMVELLGRVERLTAHANSARQRPRRASSEVLSRVNSGLEEQRARARRERQEIDEANARTAAAREEQQGRMRAAWDALRASAVTATEAATEVAEQESPQEPLPEGDFVRVIDL